VIFQLKKLVTKTGAGKEAYCTKTGAGKEAYCTKRGAGKEAYCTKTGAGKGYFWATGQSKALRQACLEGQSEQGRR